MAAQDSTKHSAPTASGSGSSSNTRSASTAAATAAPGRAQQHPTRRITTHHPSHHHNHGTAMPRADGPAHHHTSSRPYTSLITFNGNMNLDLLGAGAQFGSQASIEANASDREDYEELAV